MAERTVTRDGVTYQQETAGISGSEPTVEDQDKPGDETSLSHDEWDWDSEEEDGNNDVPLSPLRPTPPANGGAAAGNRVAQHCRLSRSSAP